ncbi:MAG: hypothetical protein ACOCUI_00470, partial [bacterium]
GYYMEITLLKLMDNNEKNYIETIYKNFSDYTYVTDLITLIIYYNWKLYCIKELKNLDSNNITVDKITQNLYDYIEDIKNKLLKAEQDLHNNLNIYIEQLLMEEIKSVIHKEIVIPTKLSFNNNTITNLTQEELINIIENKLLKEVIKITGLNYNVYKLNEEQEIIEQLKKRNTFIKQGINEINSLSLNELKKDFEEIFNNKYNSNIKSLNIKSLEILIKNIIKSALIKINIDIIIPYKFLCEDIISVHKDIAELLINFVETDFRIVDHLDGDNELNKLFKDMLKLNNKDIKVDKDLNLIYKDNNSEIPLNINLDSLKDLLSKIEKTIIQNIINEKKDKLHWEIIYYLEKNKNIPDNIVSENIIPKEEVVYQIVKDYVKKLHKQIDNKVREFINNKEIKNNTLPKTNIVNINNLNDHKKKFTEKIISKLKTIKDKISNLFIEEIKEVLNNLPASQKIIEEEESIVNKYTNTIKYLSDLAIEKLDYRNTLRELEYISEEEENYKNIINNLKTDNNKNFVDIMKWLISSLIENYDTNNFTYSDIRKSLNEELCRREISEKLFYIYCYTYGNINKNTKNSKSPNTKKNKKKSDSNINKNTKKSKNSNTKKNNENIVVGVNTYEDASQRIILLNQYIHYRIRVMDKINIDYSLYLSKGFSIISYI